MLPIEGVDEKEFKETGLNNSQIEESKKKYGINKIEAKKKVSNITRFFKQLADPMVILLIVVGFISIILTILSALGVGLGRKPIEGIELASAIVEPIIIFGIVFANAGFGMWQEGKANKEMEALQNLTSPHAKVIRNSELQIIDSKDVVVGDLLYLEAGDQISADAKLIESFNLEVNESILTGESLLVKKDANSFDESKRNIEQKNMIFSGTSVINGSAKAVVTSIGSKTEMGQISELIKKEADNLTPFQKQLHRLSKYLGYFAIAISIVTFFINIVLMSDGAFNIGLYWQQSLEVSIALSIAAVPESMLAIIMVVLATAVRRMSLKKALIKRLPSVETLGSTSIICSDKTGTLTQNKMTVVEMWNKDIPSTTNDKSKNIQMLKFGTLCTNANVSYNENNEVELVGDPTETSIIQALLDLGINKQDLNKQYKRILELPFDSDRKMMTVVVEDKESKMKIAITKGAPDKIFSICSNSDHGIIKAAEKHNHKMSSDALRVLAVSYK
ncbi:MAG: HAD-IC family P-type ATPase [Ureaplasma sp.]|nr:HAD-IC family P-type ATPase [Ureaplasma sp.]